ncbi:MAG TPA: fibronectin type III domain-containing protein, partial [Longimicrobiaceae bacterium]|nr:fibronectin type III domain-containing protein [Longimicrobiaceae bacterium]
MGPAPLGYGNDDEATVIGFGGDQFVKHITAYFRREFEVTGTLIGPLRLALQRDDGAVVYIDGQEVIRSNLPAGPIAFETPAVDALTGAAETHFHYVDLELPPLALGEHSVAVEVHQSGTNSSDVRFDLSLAAGLPQSSAASYSVSHALFHEASGTIVLVDADGGAVHRWHAAGGAYGPPGRVLAGVTLAALEQSNGMLYLAYGDGVVNRLNVTDVEPEVEFFANTGASQDIILPAGDRVLAMRGGTHRLFSTDGALLAILSGPSTPYAYWDAPNSRVLWSSSIVNSRFLLPDNTYGAGDSSQSGMSPPLRPSPDGQHLMSGSGRFADLATLDVRADALGTTAPDLAWGVGGGVFTLEPAEVPHATIIRKWSGSQWLVSATVGIGGDPVAVFRHGQDLIAVTQEHARPRVRVLDSLLAITAESASLPVDRSNFRILDRQADRIVLGWDDTFDGESGFAIRHRATSDAAWNPIVILPANSTSHVVARLQPGIAYEFQFRPVPGFAEAPFTPSLVARTLPASGVPRGEPYALAVTRANHAEVAIEWQDNASDEAAFRVFRSGPPPSQSV